MVDLRRPFARLARDTHGGAPERWAMIAGVAAVASVIGTHAIDIAVRNDALPQLAFRKDREFAEATRRLPQATMTTRQQTAAGVDYTATASIPSPAGSVVLDPCTGRIK